MVIGEEGTPHGVWRVGCVRGSSATGVKCGREERPVPPMMAMRTGSEWERRMG